MLPPHPTTPPRYVQGIFSLRGDATPGAQRIEMAIHNHYLSIYTATGNWRSTGFLPPLNTWHRARVERTNGMLRVIVNGPGSQNWAYGGDPRVWSVAEDTDYSYQGHLPGFRIGRHVTDFDGYLDNVIITSPLSEAQTWKACDRSRLFPCE